MSENTRYFFCGIGGNGMSPLARLLAARGFEVLGSDRSFDQGRNSAFFAQLQREGIRLVAQDGSGVDRSIDRFVITRAVEDTVPDIRKAREIALPIIRRPALMAELVASTENISIGGTGGKSTTTAMIGYVLKHAGRDPTIVNGAVMLDFGSNFAAGGGDLTVFEADESDGKQDVIGVCRTDIGVLTNISLDHFEIDELKDIFGSFVRRAAGGAVLNADCSNSMSLADCNSNVVTFGIERRADFSPSACPLEIKLPGRHNLSNALAAVAACSLAGVEPREAARILTGFSGIQRRLQLVGERGGIRVIDDFASNPAKIAAALSTLRAEAPRIIVIFQPHGFQPTRMMKEGYVKVFSELLRPQDVLVMPEIYYVGGSANYVDGKIVPLPKDISSRDVVEGVSRTHAAARYFAQRSDIPVYIAKEARAGDSIVVMGSRDETLPDFAAQILAAVKES